MTPEQKFDRLERIVKLMIKAGLRARTQSREQSEKINILIDAQIRNDERFARNEELFAKHEELFAKHDELFARNDKLFASLIEDQKQHGKRLDKMIKRLAKPDGEADN